jgi:hypothetical protein
MAASLFLSFFARNPLKLDFLQKGCWVIPRKGAKIESARLRKHFQNVSHLFKQIFFKAYLHVRFRSAISQ